MSSYYETGPYECRRVIKAWRLGFNLGNVLKYICRAGKKTKDPVEDLIKALDYIYFELEDQSEKTPLTEDQVKKIYRIEDEFFKWNQDNSDTA